MKRVSRPKVSKWLRSFEIIPSNLGQKIPIEWINTARPMNGPLFKGQTVAVVGG